MQLYFTLYMSTSFNLHRLSLASSFHIPVLYSYPPHPPTHCPVCLPVVLCSAGSITRNPPTLLPSGIWNLIYTDMFSQHRKQPMPLTKLRSSQRMSRRAGLQGPIIVGLSSTTSSFERRKGDWRLQNADSFVFPLFVRKLWTCPSAHLFQSGLMSSITEFI